MIEVHCARRESKTAIYTGHVAQPVEDAGVFLPARALAFEVSRRSVAKGLAGHAFTMGGAGTQAMAISAHNVTLGGFTQQALARHQHRAAFGQAKQLVCGIPVVEVHLAGQEDLATVGARPFPEISQQRNGSCLPGPDALTLGLAIPPVVGDIAGPLANAHSHGSV
jgi:hypothetical protein